MPAATGVTAPPRWAPADGNTTAVPAVLRLPAHAITDAGVIDLGGNTYAALVAASTVNIGLRSGPEQAAYRFIASPISMSAAPATMRLVPPKLGEHTDEVLSEAETVRRT